MLCKKLCSIGHQPASVIFDTTNFSTEMESDYDNKDRTLSRTGNAKDGKYGNNLVGTAIAMTNEGIPLPIGTYPGNWNDHIVINKMIDDIIDRIRDMRAESKKARSRY